MKTQIIETPDEIILRYVPVKDWIFAGILTLIFGCFCLWLIYCIFVNPAILGNGREKDWFNFLPIIVFGAAIISLIIFQINPHSIFFASLTSIIIDRKESCVDILYHRLHATRTQKFYFHQIRKFQSRKRKSLSSNYFLTLVLINGDRIKLNVPVAKEKNETVKFIKKLNKNLKTKNFSNTHTIKKIQK